MSSLRHLNLISLSTQPRPEDASPCAEGLSFVLSAYQNSVTKDEFLSQGLAERNAIAQDTLI